jgi:membrane associated rhomboid family serine protease
LTHNANPAGIVERDWRGRLHIIPGDTIDVTPDSGNEIYLGSAPQPVWLTIFSAMFLHGSIIHIAGNMLFLWIFGNNIEDALGKLRYLFFYLACGVAAAITQTASDPNSIVPNIGASGAIAGVMGAYILLWPEARVLTLIPLGCIFMLREISAFWVLGIWIMFQVLTVHFQQGGASDGVAYMAHIGGFAAGIIFILLLGGRNLARRRRRYFESTLAD